MSTHLLRRRYITWSAFMTLVAVLNGSLTSSARAEGALATLQATSVTGYGPNVLLLNGQGYDSSATASQVTIHMDTRNGRVIGSFRPTSRIEPEPVAIPCDIARDFPGPHILLAMQYYANGDLVSGLPGRANVEVAVIAAAACLPPPTTTTQPEAGQTVYRVWGADAGEFGKSWTPVGPQGLGSDEFRKKAGLPDRLNAGTTLTVGQLDSPRSVVLVRPSLPVGPTIDYGLSAYSSSGVAYREYGGGLSEYIIPEGAVHVLAPVRSPLNPAYGGPPTGCTPAPRGCVGQ